MFSRQIIGVKIMVQGIHLNIVVHGAKVKVEIKTGEEKGPTSLAGVKTRSMVPFQDVPRIQRT